MPHNFKKFQVLVKHKKVIIRVIKLLQDELDGVLEEEYSKSKTIWVRNWIDRRLHFGASSCLLEELAVEDANEFKMCLHLRPQEVDTLLNLITLLIKKMDTSMRAALTPRLKLEITLNFLATGNNFRTLNHLFRVSKSSISYIIPAVCSAIYEVLKDFIKTPCTEEEWLAISQGFNTRWNFPRCCGALDGKHVVIKAPPDCGTKFYNYKGDNSIVLMALVDHNYCFTYMHVGCNGIVSDGGVFRNCSLSTALENGLLPSGHFVVADDAFPLKENILKPLNNKPLSYQEKIFNYRLRRARRIVENAFGILVSRFRIFEKPISCKLSTVDKIVMAACTLHNWLRKSNTSTYFPAGTLDFEHVDTGEIIPGQWRHAGVTLRNIQHNKEGFRSGTLARNIRDDLKNYFLSDEGAVPWQEARIF